MSKKRTITQIALACDANSHVPTYVLAALCDDGSLWSIDLFGGPREKWVCVNDIPDNENE